MKIFFYFFLIGVAFTLPFAFLFTNIKWLKYFPSTVFSIATLSLFVAAWNSSQSDFVNFMHLVNAFLSLSLFSGSLIAALILTKLKKKEATKD